MNQKNKKKIHVVHFIPKLGIGGAEKFVVELCKNISNENIKQSIVIFWNNTELQSELPKNVTVKLFDFSKISHLKRTKIIAEYLNEIQADIIHTHLFSADLWGRLVARRLNLPVITTEHSLNTHEPILLMYIKRFMRNYSQVYTAPSRAVAEYMKKAYKIALDKTKIIYHGIETNRFVNIKPAKLTNPYNFLLIGRLSKAKGHKVAIEAISKITNIDFQLKIVGSGELKDNLINYAKKYNVTRKIEWQEANKKVEKFYEEADLVLVPSIVEGLGLVALEAMASARVVVASEVDGLAEIIKDGQNGFLFPVGNSDKLAEKIESILSDREKLLLVGKNAQNWILENARVEDMALKYENIYLNLLKK